MSATLRVSTTLPFVVEIDGLSVRAAAFVPLRDFLHAYGIDNALADLPFDATVHMRIEIRRPVEEDE